MTVQLLEDAEAVLLDFDGPVCSVFAGYPAHRVADQLRRRLTDHGIELAGPISRTRDPLAVLRLTAGLAPDHVPELDDALAEAETLAAGLAPGTPGAAEFLERCRRTGRRVVIVSNNGADGVQTYLRDHGLASLVHGVFGRPTHRPDLMKPDPAMIREALDYLAVAPGAAVLVGDSDTDVRAAHACAVPAIGYANRAEKRHTLAHAGADVVIESMFDLVDSPVTSPDAGLLPSPGQQDRDGTRAGDHCGHGR
jgi:phosphoglycolate phosphatase-like HAD superfamily hydrolase